ncbi:uncharacterized protein LOC132313969 [Cornus florida]|uniref:uncharacterized protein LOC132313969 n=1 Tax=Cornus florida TaxID=4283 RepID=UPI00289EB383|nr:uncharacterized protein LOC132313969 [Cornus florida]
MELLYLLCSIISTSFTTLVLSLLLAYKSLLRWFFIPRAAPPSSADGAEPVSLYQGVVWHERRRPVHHSFRYSARYALIDLDHAPYALSSHLSADEARRVATTTGPVFLLTIPPSVGYEQNPLSLYYCYDLDESALKLKNCIAEVTNTPWGERVSFLFNPNFDLVAKPLHVSPFMDMLGDWRIKTNAPGDELLVAISVQHPKLGDYFTATLTAKKVHSSLVDNHAVFFWLMPHKVAVWIYWHAVKLWWKNVQFIQHPRYHSPAYREEALIRDGNLQCCKAFARDTQHRLLVERSDSDVITSINGRDHGFTWRDAKWPWC